MNNAYLYAVYEDEFFTLYRKLPTAMPSDETFKAILKTIESPFPAANAGSTYASIANREANYFIVYNALKSDDRPVRAIQYDGYTAFSFGIYELHWNHRLKFDKTQKSLCDKEIQDSICERLYDYFMDPESPDALDSHNGEGYKKDDVAAAMAATAAFLWTHYDYAEAEAVSLAAEDPGDTISDQYQITVYVENKGQANMFVTQVGELKITK